MLLIDLGLLSYLEPKVKIKISVKDKIPLVKKITNHFFTASLLKVLQMTKVSIVKHSSNFESLNIHKHGYSHKDTHTWTHTHGKTHKGAH